MPRYFFVVTMGSRVIEDEVGADYKTPLQACEAAERIARDLSEDPAFDGCSIEVLDEAGETAGTVIMPGAH